MSSTNNVNTNPKAGLDALLTPDNCALLIIDHQPFQFAGVKSHDTQTIINNVAALTKTAKGFGIPTLFSTVRQERGGYLIKQLQEIYPDQKPIDRTWINAWQDERVVDWVKQTGRKKLVIAALWTEACLSMCSIHAAGEGYEVYIVTDASGGVSLEAHEMAIQRMILAGCMPITWGVFIMELQRDWARTETGPVVGENLVDYWGVVGSVLTWEHQFLATPAMGFEGVSA
ncbi:hydrolase [Ferruginibacter paludis]|uniref:hydrolase n=1 Tax=Ferruginibacter paludis TaxID=1310417 RepID=UPI0025B470CF|nr:hydrolase [Ferruginibacter paludis]MDN3656136.1 hydrolase [Ferruginibacter paludis]